MAKYLFEVSYTVDGAKGLLTAGRKCQAGGDREGAGRAGGLDRVVSLRARARRRLPDRRAPGRERGGDAEHHRRRGGRREGRIARAAHAGAGGLRPGEDGGLQPTGLLDRPAGRGRPAHPNMIGSSPPMASPSAQFSLTLRVELPHESGTLSKVTAAITKAGGAIVAVDTVEAGGTGHGARDHRGLRDGRAPRPRGQGGAGRARGASWSRPPTAPSSCTGGARSTPACRRRWPRATTCRWPTRRASRACAAPSPRTARRPSSTRSRRTRWPWSPTAPRCWAWATSAPRRPCP